MPTSGLVKTTRYLWRHVVTPLVALACAYASTAAIAAALASPLGLEEGKGPEPMDRDVAQWMDRVRVAPCATAYTGTFVVLSSSGAMTSSRIWHACEGSTRLERVDALSGTPRTVFRRNDEVRTFLPGSRVVRTERGEAPGFFPRVPVVSGASISAFYASRLLGQERVAGHAADVVWLQPRDALRFGYRLWSERNTGLLVKLQTLDAEGRVVEQAAFSELNLNSTTQADQLSRWMDATADFKVTVPTLVKTSALAEGWSLRQPVPGFVPVNCHRRALSPTEPERSILQCLYSDGLASVSLFLEPLDPQRHPAQAQTSSMGATQLLAQRVATGTWLTAVGEVPLQTLRLFAGQLERIR